MAGCGHDGTGAGCGWQWGPWTQLNQGSTDGNGGLSLHAHDWWLMEHYNGDGAGPGHGHARGRGGSAGAGGGGGGRILEL